MKARSAMTLSSLAIFRFTIIRFALGALLYEMATGQRAFGGQSKTNLTWRRTLP